MSQLRVTGGARCALEAVRQEKEDPVMSKVYGLHTFALRPGVKAEEFERFVAEAVYPAFDEHPDMGFCLLKGDRGDREGRYLALFELTSVEVRDRLFPSPGEMSEEVQQFYAPHAALFEKWETFATPLDAISTDYVVVGT